MKFGSTLKKMRTVSPTLAYNGCSSTARRPTLKAKYSRALRSEALTLNFSTPYCPWKLLIDLALHDATRVRRRRSSSSSTRMNRRTVACVRDRRCGAMINVEPRHQRLPGHRFLMARIDLQRGGAAARPGCGVEVDRVNHRTVG